MPDSDFKGAPFSSEVAAIYADWLRRSSAGARETFGELCQANASQADDLRQIHRLVEVARSATIQHPIRQLLGNNPDLVFTLDADGDETIGEAGAPIDLDLQVPDRYIVTGEIARGGMGVIYRVRDRELNRTLAMKVMLREESATNEGSSRAVRFVEEVQLSAQLDHPGIVAVHELGADSNGQPYFTMKLVKGRDLSHIFELARAEREGWSLPRAVGALIKACQAVAFAHSKGVIHRDLKPANVMVGRFGEVYVMDWGLAKVLSRRDTHDIRIAPAPASVTEIRTPRTQVKGDSADSPLITMDGSVVGTPAYMPPEQAKGQVEQVDALSDIYSLGAMLYALLTGRSPYTEPDARFSPHTILGMVIQGPPKSIRSLNANAPAELIAICEKSMAREKQNRYPSSLDLAEDMQAWIDRRVVKAYRTGPVAEFKSLVIRHPRTAFASGAVVLLLMAGLGLLLFKNKQLSAERLEANHQRNAAQENLYSSLLREARATRTARRVGYREQVFSLLRQANALKVSQKKITDLRNEAVACLGDFVGFTPQKLSGFPTNAYLNTVSLDPSGRFGAFAFHNGTIQFHELASGKKIQEIKMEPPTATLAWNPSGDEMMTVQRPNLKSLTEALERAIISRWKRLPSGEWEFIESRPNKGAFFAAHAANRFVIGTIDTESKWLQLFEYGGRELQRMPHATDGALLPVVAMSPDGRSFASTRRIGNASGTNSITVVDMDTGIKSELFHPSGSWFIPSDFSSDSRHLVTLHHSGAIIYQMPDLKPLIEINEHSSQISFSPSGRYLAIPLYQQSRIRLWDWKQGSELAILDQGLPGAKFSGDGRFLATFGYSEAYASVFRLDASDEKLMVSGHRGGTPGVAFSPDGQRLASTGKDRMLRLSDLGSGETIWETGPIPGFGQGVTFSPDGKLIATVSFSSQIVAIWNAQTGAPLLELGTNTAADTWSVQFSPNGKFLCAAGLGEPATPRESMGIKVWKIRAQTVLMTNLTLEAELIASQPGDFMGAAFTPDSSKILADNRQKNSCELWDFESADPPLTLFTNMPFHFQTTALTRKGNQCLIRDLPETIRVFDLTSGREISSFSVNPTDHQRGEIGNIALSPDGTKLACSSPSRRSVEIWDYSSRRFLYSLPEESGTVWWLAWSPDSQRLAVSRASGNIAVWNLPGIDRALAEAKLDDDPVR